MQAIQPRSGRLTHMGLLRFTGPDALHFLQGQLTNDTKLLTANSVMLAAYLNPQGRVLALMHLLPHSSGTLAILPRELTQPVAQRMRKYVLRAKVKIEDPGESLVVSGWHGVEALAHAVVPVPPADQQYVEARGIGVAKVGDGSRYWVVAPAAGLPALAEDARLDPEGAHASTVERDWRLADIRAGLPQVYGATSEAFVAQMLNLDLLQGISFSKGCYTGQEIVARTQHLGRIKRRLFHLRLPPRAGAWRIGDELTLSDGRRGRLTEVIAAEHDIEALAVLSLEPQPATDGEPAPGDSAAPLSTTAVQVPLPYALG